MKFFGLITYVFLICSCSVFAEYPYDYDLKEITGLKVPKNFKPDKNETPIFRAGIPDTWDWRDVGLTDVKNQGTCGSCWAVAATTVFQDVVKIKTGRETLLSEQELLDCNLEGWGCGGGFIPHDYFVSKGKKGAVDGYDYIYKGVKGSCRKNIKPIEAINGWKFVSQAGDRIRNMKESIYLHGPLWAGIYADNRMQSFRGGKVFNTCTNGTPNHAIAIVGWGVDHWIIKNSWGTNWGDDGYARIKFNCNNIGEYANYLEYDGFTPEPMPDMNLCIGEDSAVSKTSLPIRITVFNRTQNPVDVYWIDYNKNRKFLMTLQSWKYARINTQRQHYFVAVEKSTGNCVELWRSNGERDWYIL